MISGRQRSTGCSLCRRRKIKCDERKPTCLNCQSYGQPCPGYTRFSFPIIFRSENRRVEALVRRRKKGSKESLGLAVASEPGTGKGAETPADADADADAHAAPTPRSPLDRVQDRCMQKDMQKPVPRYLDTPWEVQSHCFFREQYTMPPEVDGSPGPLDSVPLLYLLCQEQDLTSNKTMKDEGENAPVSCLRAALDAAAFAALANKARLPSLGIQARRKYGLALRELNRVLGSVDDAVKTETLGAIVMLIIFEDINNERDRLLSTHITGIQYLLKLRGLKQLQDPATRSLFHFAFTQMTIQFLGFNDPLKIDLDWLLALLTIPHPIYTMMAGVSRIGKFCATATQKLFSSLPREPLTSLLETGERLDLEFNQWYRGMPDEWLPRRIASQSGGGKTLLMYPDQTAAGVWNYYRGARIVLQRCLVEVHKRLDPFYTSSSPPPPYPDLDQDRDSMNLESPNDIITTMVSDICDTIPFAIGDVDDIGLQSRRKEGTGLKAIQEFALLWPIWSITQCEQASGEQKELARHTLRRLGLSNGIKLGLGLADGGDG
ncbi:hypothetical protein P170DRAFT_456487 [Aspergillus steynii IBT 23096]|uniref:Zn(2)-C6 fungal-type domain-containing protein n=1 Tax=Aspergillus steynii IBT 23096 TaxID=1392250 RepID=A0A2I2G4A0_9EURO|nr:uncharacterized protein P170DRAFT_456487 [Aspergillus steynii IBT 23096]PLB47698.1 hypothetical protein P170DRAFT_456487 [Aspergillus steynii IBT 23096]